MVRASANSFLNNLTIQYQSIYILRLGATPFQLGLVNGIGGIAGTVVAAPTGWLADRCGIRRMFLLGIPLITLSCLLFAIAPNWTATIPAILLTFLATQLLSTACPMVCGSYLKNEERATGKQLCDTISAIPTLATPMIAAVLITDFGGLIQVVGFLLVFAFTYKFYFDTINNQGSLNPSSFADGMKHVFERGVAVKRWAVYIFLSSTSMYTSMTYLYAFVTEIKQGNEFVVGGMTTASLVLPLLLSLVVGRLADTYGRKKVLYITLPLYCTSVVLLIYAQNTMMLLVSGVLQGFYLLSAVTQGAMTAELVPVHLLGRWYGILNLFRGLASVTAPIIGGLIWSTISPSFVFLFIILIEATKIIILWLMIPETLRRV